MRLSRTLHDAVPQPGRLLQQPYIASIGFTLRRADILYRPMHLWNVCNMLWMHCVMVLGFRFNQTFQIASWNGKNVVF